MSAVTTPLATASLMKPQGTAIPTAGTGLPGATTANPMALPNATTPTVTPTAMPVPVTSTGGISPIGSAGFDQLYGNDTGNAVSQLLNSESSTTANSEAQAIIAANAPNVAQGAANLNTQLAAGGISPSSSVSAIENANYQGQVAQGDQSELAQVNMQEQQMQQQLLESLLPGQQQRETESSGWSIFNDVMTGIGDVTGV